MSGWLGQVPLRVSNRQLGGLNSPALRTEHSNAFLGQKAPRKRMGEVQCCNAPNGMSYCFDHSSGECINTWNSANPTPGAPDCVKNAEGFWVHPSCPGAQGAASGSTPVTQPPASSGGKPPALACPMGGDKWALLNYVDNSVIVENVTRAEFDAYSSDITDLPADMACDDPRCAPYCAPPEVSTPPPAPIPQPTPGTSPIPASGVPVLPQSQTMTTPAQPTGAWPGQPFPTKKTALPPISTPIPAPVSPPMPQPIPLTRTKAPIPQACPLGPVPLRQWVDDCVAKNFY